MSQSSVLRYLRILLFGCCAWLIVCCTAGLAQQPKILAPHRALAPKVKKPFPLKPAAQQSAVGGLWMTGPSMKSSLYLRNDLKTDSLTVTPILYLSNGLRYSLTPVILDPTGTALIDIGQSLEAQGIASYANLYGYAEIEYQWPWAVVCATIKNVDALHSLIFTYPLQPPADRFPKFDGTKLIQTSGAPETSGVHSFEGLWWKQESNVSGFLGLANLGRQTVNATVKLTDDKEATLSTHQVSISPHATKMLDLSELKSAAARVGGIYLTHDGPEHSLAINGGLSDETVGYSAHMYLTPVPETASGAQPPISKFVYSQLGVMAGYADPMMAFPAGTVFTPYSVIRNVSSQPATITPTLWWMQGGAPRSSQSVSITLAPHQTLDLNVPSLLDAAGMKNFNGSVNLILDTTAQTGALTMVSGSVDKNNTYVFEVMSRGVMESAAKTIPYWSTGNGDDTMVTLWNPADEDQDLVYTLFFSGGHYAYPIHLAAKATRSFNISEVVRSAIPDPEGNVIPSAIHEGSAEIVGSLGEHQHILVNMDTGIYNVNKAVCAPPTCETCQGLVSLSLVDNPFAVPVSATRQQTFYAQWSTGSQYNLTGSSTWSSDTTSVATVNGGLVTGVSPGSVNISAYYGYNEPPYIANYCYMFGNGACPSGGPVSGSSPGTVTVKILLGGSNGTDITNSTQSVVVGQQIVLYASYGSGVTVNNQQWSVAGTTVGGFNTGANNGGPISPTFTGQSTTFYWVVPANSQTVTFTLNYGNSQTATAQATFNIAGPTNAGVTTALGSVAINPGPFLQFGSTTGSNIGINFTASASQPTGYSPIFKWANFISNDTVILTSGNGQQTHSLGAGLDNAYPSFPPVTSTTTNDNPKYPLTAPCTEVKRTFDSKTYLMWNSGVSNSIDVPLGYVSWGFSGDAVLSSGVWILVTSNSSKYAVGFTATSAYPTWTSLYSNGVPPSCP